MPTVGAVSGRPLDDDVVPLAVALQWQREYVVEAGSPTAALILTAVMDDLAAGGILATVLPRSARFGSLPGLRIMAAVHGLALQRRAPTVAMFLPTLGGRTPTSVRDSAAFARAVVDALAAHPIELADAMDRTPQTNETGRAALLRCALSREDPTRPVRLFELGASAGLNLRADLLPGQAALEAGALPPVVERVGCDLNPVDCTTTAGRTLLSSYVWVDDVDRFGRLAAAMDIAAREPAELVQADAADFVAGLVLEPGTTTVVWHSAMWVYLTAETQQLICSALAGLGQRATPAMPLVHVSWEWADDDAAGFSLVVRRWDGGPASGRPRLLATGMSHGRDVVLTEPERWLEGEPLVRPAG